VDAVPGEHLVVAETAEEYAEAILRLLEQPAERARLSLAGRERIVSHLTWVRSMQRFDEIVGRCLEAWRGARGDLTSSASLSAERP
jgi:polysaccharide biosynthesis protein PslH